jgi:hypothetical protein
VRRAPCSSSCDRREAYKKRSEREQGKDPQLEKPKAHEEAMREREAERQREYQQR